MRTMKTTMKKRMKTKRKRMKTRSNWIKTLKKPKKQIELNLCNKMETKKIHQVQQCKILKVLVLRLLLLKKIMLQP
ncbi:hypothetical protein ABG067_009637, partial [Albugo candida]